MTLLPRFATRAVSGAKPILHWLSLAALLAMPFSVNASPPGGTVEELGNGLVLPAVPPPDFQQEVASLIEDLGAEQFASRERAQAELQRLGLVVFDDLTAAQESDDLEIALRTKYVLNRMTIPWVHEDDSAEVRQYLRGYAANLPVIRRSLMDQLASLPDYQGVAALCRMARFETSILLSKHAALQVLQQPSCHASEAAQRLSETIRLEVEHSQRTSTSWLRAYALMLEQADPRLEVWDECCQLETQCYHNSPEASSFDIVRDLLRCRADFLHQHQREEEALAGILQSMELLTGTQEELQETVDWLLQREAWELVILVAERFREQFDSDVGLLYQLAEAHWKQGNAQAAQEAAGRALVLNPEDLTTHIETAQRLQSRGFLDWAEAEYRHVIAHGAVESKEAMQARISYLSEMLHDVQRDWEAAEVLQGALDAIDADQNVRYLVNSRLQRTTAGIRSRMHFFQAEHYRVQGDTAKQHKALQEGMKHDDADVDLLIGMHRLEDADATWRSTTRSLIEKASTTFRLELAAYRRLAAESRSESDRRESLSYLAITCNQFAWLVANTDGDYDEALRCSQLSLEIFPGRATFLDTLGRCYYAKQDFENAVKFQRQSARLEPHTTQIQRQLQLFEQALADRQRKDEVTGDPRSS